MSDQEFEAYVRFFEANISGRQLTADERAFLEKEYNSPASFYSRLNSDPMALERANQDFMRRLKSRQGSILPVFEELYRRKMELDGEA